MVAHGSTRRYDWAAIDVELRDRGMVCLPELLSAQECEALIDLWDEGMCFEHEVQRGGEGDGGAVTYRFFSRPLPALVAGLRSEIYARLAIVATSRRRAPRHGVAT